MYHTYTEIELREYCRTNIETLEIWARRLIHEKMVEEYGENYINKQFDDGNFLVKSEIRKHIQGMLEKERNRFQRAVDTLFIEQIIYFLCHPVFYKKLFKPALDYIYPQGRDEAKEFLSRLVPIRNPLSHSNPISMHDAERAICYSHDFIEGLKKYYKERGEEQVWNVPKIIKVKDSLGNVFYNSLEDQNPIFVVKEELYFGDEYSVEIEVDSSYDKSEYDIVWKNYNRNDNKSFKNNEKYTIKFKSKDVAKLHMIECRVIQKKDWHKYTYYDSKITLHLTVLPPI
ncbi:MAG: hypothetical protein IJ362_05630 [Oscillospiraceae bacterium]|nr:hypothetical protein [Oscillospiraceae bacterium]